MKEASATGRPTATGERRTAHKAHARLVELVKKGDADAAADYWKDHLEGLRNFLLGGSNPKTVVDLFG